MNLHRRAATDADLPFLLDLRRQTMDVHLIASGIDVSDQAHRVRIADQFDVAEILLADGEPAGLLKLRRDAEVWDLIQLQLAAHLQGRGIGRAVLETVIAEATAAGADVKLSVLKHNPARRLYERLGFQCIAEDDVEFFMRRSLRIR